MIDTFENHAMVGGYVGLMVALLARQVRGGRCEAARLGEVADEYASSATRERIGRALAAARSRRPRRCGRSPSARRPRVRRAGPRIPGQPGEQLAVDHARRDPGGRCNL